MRFSWMVLIALTACANDTAPSEQSPRLSNRELCNHFANEEPYDEGRANFLKSNVEAYCK